jgi:dUTP pyrophosphatase
VISILIRASAGKSPRLPEYKTLGASGADIYACLAGQIQIEPGETVAIATGFSIAIPEGLEAQVRPRSGLALEYNIGLLNSPGTIDSDYRGEVKILMTNFGKKPFIVRDGDRIAQMVISPVVKAKFISVEELPSSDRGTGGFGHTGR